ncbi:hypothetical protein EDD17DRAFT_1584632 [Pisolithus thermaeus]|nr:hypothetical protein EV401DRAFT_669871 [Pisolithus croceorrhizus]KAI6161628.1 hypothetical protein EDD17DRAFT_1584632 [Pisolithus thermaeus]
MSHVMHVHVRSVVSVTGRSFLLATLLSTSPELMLHCCKNTVYWSGDTSFSSGLTTHMSVPCEPRNWLQIYNGRCFLHLGLRVLLLLYIALSTHHSSNSKA